MLEGRLRMSVTALGIILFDVAFLFFLAHQAFHPIPTTNPHNHMIVVPSMANITGYHFS